MGRASRSGKLVLGIDPGSIITGYGIVGEENGELFCQTYGVLEAPSKGTLAERLLIIGEGIQKLLTQYSISAVSLEKTFFSKNVDSVTKLSHARGVLLYEVARQKIEVFEYTPTAVKSSIAGSGRAEKAQVQFLVRTLLQLEALEKFDMSDALALAIHHVRQASTKDKIQEMTL